MSGSSLEVLCHQTPHEGRHSPSRAGLLARKRLHSQILGAEWVNQSRYPTAHIFLIVTYMLIVDLIHYFAIKTVRIWLNSEPHLICCVALRHTCHLGDETENRSHISRLTHLQYQVRHARGTLGQDNPIVHCIPGFDEQPGWNYLTSNT